MCQCSRAHPRCRLPGVGSLPCATSSFTARAEQHVGIGDGQSRHRWPLPQEGDPDYDAFFDDVLQSWVERYLVLQAAAKDSLLQPDAAAIDRQVPETQVSLLGIILIGAGIFPTSAQQPLTERVEAPPAGPTPAYGGYLVEISGCRECHGPDLSGGTSQFVPVGPPLPPIVSRWSAEEFVTTIRTGVDPNGHSLNSDIMPWQDYSAAYTDAELEAIYTYLLERTGSELP